MTNKTKYQKTVKILTIIVILFVMTIQDAAAQTPYTSTVDDKKVTILNGIITKYALINNDAFKSWYTSNEQSYTPAAPVVASMEAAKDNVQYIIFGGTWCGDTQFILPKFFKLQAQAGVADKNISFFGVDRQKKTLGNLQAAFGITNVPTIIIMKNGVEQGRVVEYGKTGKWDEEIAAILKK
jgi:thiol-disulfide isomerase/thioredoxin